MLKTREFVSKLMDFAAVAVRSGLSRTAVLTVRYILRPKKNRFTHSPKQNKICESAPGLGLAIFNLPLVWF